MTITNSNSGDRMNARINLTGQLTQVVIGLSDVRIGSRALAVNAGFFAWRTASHGR
jgi:hypothetical protein